MQNVSFTQRKTIASTFVCFNLLFFLDKNDLLYLGYIYNGRERGRKRGREHWQDYNL